MGRGSGLGQDPYERLLELVSNETQSKWEMVWPQLDCGLGLEFGS